MDNLLADEALAKLIEPDYPRRVFAHTKGVEAGLRNTSHVPSPMMHTKGAEAGLRNTSHVPSPMMHTKGAAPGLVGASVAGGISAEAIDAAIDMEAAEKRGLLARLFGKQPFPNAAELDPKQLRSIINAEAPAAIAAAANAPKGLQRHKKGPSKKKTSKLKKLKKGGALLALGAAAGLVGHQVGANEPANTYSDPLR